MNLFGQPKFDIEKLRKHIEKLKIEQEKQLLSTNFDPSPTAWPTSMERKENKYGFHLDLKNTTSASLESKEPVYIEVKHDVPILQKDPIRYKSLKQRYHTRPLRMSTVSLNASTNFHKESIYIKTESATPKCFQRSILSKHSVFQVSSSSSCASQFEEDLFYNSNIPNSSPNSSKFSWKSLSFHRKANSFGGENVKSLSKGGGFMAAGPLINIKIQPQQLSSPHSSAHSEDVKNLSYKNFRSVKNPIFPSYKAQPNEDIFENNCNRIKRRRL
ncbi:unnamed protein product [Blepharisma stoltei]|uniref:Exophilin 5 n=1 Tax=Blepharisma stoltei TaxID=1481888 RepID=A0AAU9JCA0_9CILI|nr:unnamed protein product [Blepharisma stoltei]